MYQPDFYGFFQNLYTVAQTVPGDASGFYHTVLSYATVITIVGLSLAFTLLILIIYVSIKLEYLEHEGFHHREMAEHAHHEAKLLTQQGKNPRWEGVVLLANSPDEGNWRRAILDADILLGDMLREKGYPGDTIGEQLKMANPMQFTTIDLAWQGHKMRNALAHLGEAFPLSERDTHATIEQYRRVFEEFDYI